MRMKSTPKNEMYMANARHFYLGPNATYIPLTRVGGFALGDAKDTNVLASFALGNARTQRELFCVAVEYRLYILIHIIFTT